MVLPEVVLRRGRLACLGSRFRRRVPLRGRQMTVDEYDAVAESLSDAPNGRLRIAPLKTQLFHRVQVTGLHFKGERIDFTVEGDRVKKGRIPSGIKIET